MLFSIDTWKLSIIYSNHPIQQSPYALLLLIWKSLSKFCEVIICSSLLLIIALNKHQLTLQDMLKDRAIVSCSVRHFHRFSCSFPPVSKVKVHRSYNHHVPQIPRSSVAAAVCVSQSLDSLLQSHKPPARPTITLMSSASPKRGQKWSKICHFNSTYHSPWLSLLSVDQETKWWDATTSHLPFTDLNAAHRRELFCSYTARTEAFYISRDLAIDVLL